MEPYRLKRWEIGSSPNNAVRFFTCARPGRSNGPKGFVSDHLVSTWVCGLPGPDTAIISLLGHKPGPKKVSEFSFYSFCGGFDTPNERRSQTTFQEWLDHQHKDLQIIVREYPTIDCPQVPSEKLAAIASGLWDLISIGRTVVVMDSGGVQRTGKVRMYLNAREAEQQDGGD